MASRRGRVRRIRKALLTGFVQELESQRDIPPGSPREEAVNALLAEFRRRAVLPVHAPPPGHAALPGLETA